MPVNMETYGFGNLPPEDRLALARELWESVVAEQPDAILDATRRAELRRRAQEDDESPENTVSWEEVWARIQQRIGR